ncbi:X-domain of DnaJ-containing-domain-containing protein [Cantharellus anzutake]|uniref:X-domain of DnaJ-containing-domain-containing protein n=1 Tax=Cantharellus anzutake TaxID=1750568 RepID=UPI001904CF7B|nr:X-domain of DnaJ-containing-domain-containing protein [Cantharellus anzutake]KAF8335414.1 X-domain of DnaJ-containing-domain-containing protein [Cantharellus anzutake]
MSSTEVLPSRLAVPHVQIGPCSECSKPLEFLPPTSSTSSSISYQVQCFQCGNIQSHSINSLSHGGLTSLNGAQGNGDSSSSSGARKGRKIGTNERPLETRYYDLLGVPINATDEEIKKAYRRQAIKNHPDKGGSEEVFKEIAMAYQVLSDPVLRKKYNEFGPKEGSPEGGFVDPEEIFSAIFGGERFVPIIGDISLGRDMKAALQEADEAEASGQGKKGKEALTPEEKAKKEEKDKRIAAEVLREERVRKLVAELERKLSIFSESAVGPDDRDVLSSWKQICQIEAEELKQESYGVELLHAVGHAYVAKARHYAATNSTFLGVGGWMHGIKGTYHTFTETVSTVRSALELKQVFEQLAEAEKSGASEAEKKNLEEQAAEKGLQALFKGTKLEIDSVLRETCDRVLNPPPNGPNAPSREKLALRTRALLVLGEAYLNVKKEGSALDEAEYVRIDTKASKARDSWQGRQGPPR